MSLKIYMDVHVPSAVTSGLRLRGIDVLTSQEDQTTRSMDGELLTRSASLGRLLLTQDQDFFMIAAEWEKSGREFPGIFFARHGIEIGRIVTDLELCLKCCEREELRNRIIHLPLR